MADHVVADFGPARRNLLCRGKNMSVRGREVVYDEAYFIRPGRASPLLESELESFIFGQILFPRNQEQRQIFRDLLLNMPGLATTFLTIVANGTPNMMRTFEGWILRQGPPHAQADLHLPLSRERAISVFGHEAPGFLEIQPKKDAIKLIEGNFEQRYDARHCLPYSSQTLRAEGSFGKVHIVEIEQGHYKKVDGGNRFSNEETMSLARKDFEPDQLSIESFQTENGIFKTLHDTDPPSSIMRAKCSITIELDNEQYPAASIFSEPARFNLWQYLTTERQLDLNERLHNLQQMLQIGHGLEWLHHHKKRNVHTRNKEEVTYIHGDLKPDNILLYPNPGDPESCVFKIGDFGEAFLLTQSKEKTSVSRLRRVGTYRAPECIGEQIGTKSDVWSFGCILLLVLLYSLPTGGGPQSVRDFATKRAELQGQGRNQDVFYQTKRPKHELRHYFASESVCNEAVTNCIKGMISSNETSANAFDRAIPKILDYIQSKILVPEKRRADISRVCKDLENIITDAMMTFAKYPFEKPFYSRYSYCTHSPDGNVFFYSPEKITFYHSDGRKHVEVRKGPLEGQLRWSDQVMPNSRACGTSAICLVHKTAPRDTTQLSIRRFGESGRSTEVHLAEFAGVNGVSLSPDQEYLAVAFKSSRQGIFDARVRMYRVSDPNITNRLAHSTIDATDPTNATAATASTEATTSTAAVREDDRIQNGEIRNVLERGHVDIVFSGNGGTLFHAHRRVRKTEQAVVSMWDAGGAFVSQTILEDKDTNGRDIFLTGIVPLYNVRGFLAVTHGKYVIRRVWSASDDSWTETKSTPMSGLKSVLVARDNSRVVILGTPNGNLLELHVGTVRNNFDISRLSTKETIHFNHRQDSAHLREEGGGWLELQVASKQEKCIFAYRFKI